MFPPTLVKEDEALPEIADCRMDPEPSGIATLGSGRGGPTQVRPCRRQPAGFLAPKKQKNTQKTLIKSKLNQN